jgi:hypothetical protein
VSAAADIEMLDRQRERWRRARLTMRLAEPTDELFALGGFGGRVRELTARIVVLPADPNNHRIEFDDDFWKMWMTELKSPFPARELRWGSTEAPTTSAGARCDQVVDSRWGRYAALDHAGALDIGLGSQAGCRGERKEWQGVCYLLPIVATVWEACHVYGHVGERYGLEPPWELSVALRQTTRSVLGQFATGWAEPDTWTYTPEVCSDTNILLIREIVETNEGWCKSIAFSVGTQIENAFGSRSQRFRSITNRQLGDFDLTRWR